MLNVSCDKCDTACFVSHNSLQESSWWLRSAYDFDNRIHIFDLLLQLTNLGDYVQEKNNGNKEGGK